MLEPPEERRVDALIDPFSLDRLADTVGLVLDPDRLADLDVRASVGETTRRAGLPTTVMRARKRLRHVVVLAWAGSRTLRERPLHRELVRGFRARGVPALLGHWDAGLRWIRMEGESHPVSLDRLHQNENGAVILLVGEVDGLLDLDDGLGLLRPFRRVAWIDPRDPAAWTGPCRRLARELPLFSTDPRGWAALAAWIARGETRDASVTSVRREPPGASWRPLSRRFVALTAREGREVQGILGPALAWTAALAACPVRFSAEYAWWLLRRLAAIPEGAFARTGRLGRMAIDRIRLLPQVREQARGLVFAPSLRRYLWWDVLARRWPGLHRRVLEAHIEALEASRVEPDSHADRERRASLALLRWVLAVRRFPGIEPCDQAAREAALELRSWRRVEGLGDWIDTWLSAEGEGPGGGRLVEEPTARFSGGTGVLVNATATGREPQAWTRATVVAVTNLAVGVFIALSLAVMAASPDSLTRVEVAEGYPVEDIGWVQQDGERKLGVRAWNRSWPLDVPEGRWGWSALRLEPRVVGEVEWGAAFAADRPAQTDPTPGGRRIEKLLGSWRVVDRQGRLLAVLEAPDAEIDSAELDATGARAEGVVRGGDGRYGIGTWELDGAEDRCVDGQTWEGRSVLRCPPQGRYDPLGPRVVLWIPPWMTRLPAVVDAAGLLLETGSVELVVEGDLPDSPGPYWIADSEELPAVEPGRGLPYPELPPEPGTSGWLIPDLDFHPPDSEVKVVQEGGGPLRVEWSDGHGNPAVLPGWISGTAAEDDWAGPDGRIHVGDPGSDRLVVLSPPTDLPTPVESLLLGEFVASQVEAATGSGSPAPPADSWLRRDRTGLAPARWEGEEEVLLAEPLMRIQHRTLTSTTAAHLVISAIAAPQAATAVVDASFGTPITVLALPTVPFDPECSDEQGHPVACAWRGWFRPDPGATDPGLPHAEGVSEQPRDLAIGRWSFEFALVGPDGPRWADRPVLRTFVLAEGAPRAEVTLGVATADFVLEGADDLYAMLDGGLWGGGRTSLPVGTHELHLSSYCFEHTVELEVGDGPDAYAVDRAEPHVLRPPADRWPQVELTLTDPWPGLKSSLVAVSFAGDVRGERRGGWTWVPAEPLPCGRHEVALNIGGLPVPARRTFVVKPSGPRVEVDWSMEEFGRSPKVQIGDLGLDGEVPIDVTDLGDGVHGLTITVNGESYGLDSLPDARRQTVPVDPRYYPGYRAGQATVLEAAAPNAWGYVNGETPRAVLEPAPPDLPRATPTVTPSPSLDPFQQLREVYRRGDFERARRRCLAWESPQLQGPAPSDSRPPEVLALCALASHHLGDETEAKNLLERAAVLDPLHVLRPDGYDPEDVAWYLDSLRRLPRAGSSLAPAAFDRAAVYYDDGHHVGALTLLEAFFAAPDGDLEPALVRDAHVLWAAAILASGGDRGVAIERLRMALAVDPDLDLSGLGEVPSELPAMLAKLRSEPWSDPQTVGSPSVPESVVLSGEIVAVHRSTGAPLDRGWGGRDVGGVSLRAAHVTPEGQLEILGEVLLREPGAWSMEVPTDVGRVSFLADAWLEERLWSSRLLAVRSEPVKVAGEDLDGLALELPLDPMTDGQSRVLSSLLDRLTQLQGRVRYGKPCVPGREMDASCLASDLAGQALGWKIPADLEEQRALIPALGEARLVGKLHSSGDGDWRPGDLLLGLHQSLVYLADGYWAWVSPTAAPAIDLTTLEQLGVEGRSGFVYRFSPHAVTAD